MPRILAIDYGTKRVGLAVTDPGQIIATSLGTVHSGEVISFLGTYLSKEDVETFVVGDPRKMDNTPSSVSVHVDQFILSLKKHFPNIPVERMDERFTSSMAQAALLASGLKKKDRQRKDLVDQASAVIILQSYMEAKGHKSRS
ncbi:MAG: Holliday junction resolvase RuvX [Bacteroidia bacterium]|nr:Holliday junction resolvase RuvX [Bacteroidia bacterium]